MPTVTLPTLIIIGDCVTSVTLTTLPSMITVILPVAFSGNSTAIFPFEILSKLISTSVSDLALTTNVVLLDLASYNSSPI